MKALIFMAAILYSFQLKAQDSILVGNIYLKGELVRHHGPKLPETVIDSILIDKIGINYNQYLSKCFFEYHKRYDFKRNLKDKVFSIFLSPENIGLPWIYINGRPALDKDIEEIQKHRELVSYSDTVRRSGLYENIRIFEFILK